MPRKSANSNAKRETRPRTASAAAPPIAPPSAAPTAPPVALPAAPEALAEVKRDATPHVPWYIWCGVLAVTSVVIGAYWDVSWHRSIGRDTFWTPAHMAIYACGVLAAISCGYLIFTATFYPQSARAAASISLFGFGESWLRGPLGAFLATWGGIAMLTSAPFDNWWHNAYGLDVKIVSPPHVLLIVGIWAINLGILLLVLSYMNRAGISDPDAKIYRQMQWIFLYVGSISLILQMFFRMEYTAEVALHTAFPYIILAIGLPLWMAMFWTAARHRWANTIAAGIYSVYLIALILILPLFAAQPKLGPVFQTVTHFIPPKFPLLLIAPSIALDIFWERNRIRNQWLMSLASGLIFIGVFVVFEWPFASFMMSPWARNRFFGADYFGYAEPSWGFDVLHKFVPGHGAGHLFFGLLLAVVLSALCFRIGFAFGEWMKKVQR
jgi:hypothetical protein